MARKAWQIHPPGKGAPPRPSSSTPREARDSRPQGGGSSTPGGGGKKRASGVATSRDAMVPPTFQKFIKRSDRFLENANTKVALAKAKQSEDEVPVRG